MTEINQEPQEDTANSDDRSVGSAALLGGLSGLMANLQWRLKGHDPEEHPGIWDQTVREIQTIRDAKYVVKCYERQELPNNELSDTSD